jgi:glycosyltransferase involved in cell wall biosynthesis
MECGYKVNLIGRKLPESLPLPPSEINATRMNLLFKRGPLFYLFFNLRLFIKLLLTPSDLLFANDLDTLLPNYLASKLKRIPLVYDSHELFTEVPELLNAPAKRKIWLRLEQMIVPRLKNCITVNESISKIFEEKYRVKFHVIRNIPQQPICTLKVNRQSLNMPLDKKIILLQGAGINIDRGAEELVDAMEFINEAVLYIIGGGDVWPILEEKVKSKKLNEKVVLIRKIPKHKLMEYTANADLGISIDKNTNLNYYYSLPNKIFDYLSAGVPVLATRLPEIEKIIKKYSVGSFIESHEPKHISETINNLFSGAALQEYKMNTVKAAAELNWANEREKYLDIIKHIKY